MKIAFVVSLVLLALLTGCRDNEGHRIKKEDGSRFMCVDGVKYLTWDKGITVMLDKNSKVIPCN